MLMHFILCLFLGFHALFIHELTLQCIAIYARIALRGMTITLKMNNKTQEESIFPYLLNIAMRKQRVLQKQS